MKVVDYQIQCPACASKLEPRVLGCEGCGIRVEGKFRMNEFATLAEEDLHFLRIFIRSEGRIRDMESALGLSYPTIRTRLTALKEKLVAAARPPEEETRESAGEILEKLRTGELPFDEAMERIRALKPESKRKK